MRKVPRSSSSGGWEHGHDRVSDGRESSSTLHQYHPYNLLFLSPPDASASRRNLPAAASGNYINMYSTSKSSDPCYRLPFFHLQYLYHIGFIIRLLHHAHDEEHEDSIMRAQNNARVTAAAQKRTAEQSTASFHHEQRDLL